ncbi:Uma2 family endonuclease [uncultured Imperialibacter sp.]|uniref:Uma2 family endonuclease n=1 Tax=uncultured Imperialibacter sp. TaxID=1672639 RepID=UPI0030D76491|tara:strand:- start:164763 stop:165341 length:579 start_codon:yes stop_codon:yes gene_type:complete
MAATLLKFPERIRFSDDELLEICLANKELRIERDVKGNLIIDSLAGCRTSRFGLKILAQLGNWAEKNSSLGIAFSNGGFILPDGSMKAAPATWVSLEKWSQISGEQKNKFAPITPEFVVEFKSPSDSIPAMKKKMEEWIANGVQLGWLIDPELKKAFIYKPSQPVKEVDSFDFFLDGENVLPGFRLDLSKLI